MYAYFFAFLMLDRNVMNQVFWIEGSGSSCFENKRLFYSVLKYKIGHYKM